MDNISMIVLSRTLKNVAPIAIGGKYKIEKGSH